MSAKDTYPPRFDWTPKKPEDPKESPRINIRESGTGDFESLYSLLNSDAVSMKVSRKRLAHWLKWFHYSVYVAVRNLRHIVGFVVAKHDPVTSENRLISIWVAPAYRRRKVATRLLWHSTLEQPDYPTIVLADLEDHFEFEGFLRHQGFIRDAQFIPDDQHANESRWTHKSHTALGGR